MAFLIMIRLTTHQWLAPFVVSKIGPKKALVIGATIMLLRISPILILFHSLKCTIP